MNRKGQTKLWCAFVLVACWGCGLRPVELLPVEPVQPGAVGTDEFVAGHVPPEALARFRSQRTEQGEPLLQLIQPATPELIVPADLAPIAFEWLSDNKGKPAMMGMPALPMAMMPAADLPPMAAGHAAPPAVDPLAGPKADKEKMPKADKDRPIAYELRAHSELADVRVYTDGTAAALPPERWRMLLRQHSGATLRIELRGVYRDSVIVHAPALELRVRPAMPAGLFYGFSTSGQGITVGQLSDTHERSLPVPASLAQSSQRCVGCHAVSLDGKHMLATNAGESQVLRWSLVSDDALALDWPVALAASGYIQATFDPTAARIAASAAGQLLIFNADTGSLLQQTGMPLMASVSSPNWSPDGRSIVVASARGPADADGGSLARLAVGLDGLSALMPLIEATGDEHLRAPVYSPDSEWIAYERRMGPAGEGRNSKLFLVRASGGAPIELRALAQGTKPMDGASSPTFARADEPGHVYLLFSSRRAVGSFVPQEGQRQLFAAELDLSRAAAGEDPSHAAFWLPFQQRTNSYLRVQWAQAQAACTQKREVCDDKDDDCDGVADEECCVPAAESCGDGADNDCDALVDEGCECGFQEACGNQKDDDCDLTVDERPCTPSP
jgi:hypothetical protein